MLGIIGLSVAALAFRDAGEPRFDGQPLSYHLASLTYGDVRRERAAREAVHAIGSNAVPHLVRILDARESRSKSLFNQLAGRQSIVRFRFEALAVRQIHAAMACQELGPTAAPAIPSLARLMDDSEMGSWAVAALAEIGPQTLPLLTKALLSARANTRCAAAGHLRLMRPPELAVPPLVAALAHSDPDMRRLAAQSLGAMRVNSPEVVTALASRLDDPVAEVRVNAAVSLGWYGPAALAHVARLAGLYENMEGAQEQWRVGEALKAIDPSAAESAGAK
jgi:HEAT repeat protein